MIINKDKKIIAAKDADKVKIIKVLWKDSKLVKDIIFEFPDEYGFGPLSFMDLGLINASPEGIEYTENSRKNFPIVKIEFYGVIEEREEE